MTVLTAKARCFHIGLPIWMSILNATFINVSNVHGSIAWGRTVSMFLGCDAPYALSLMSEALCRKNVFKLRSFERCSAKS